MKTALTILILGSASLLSAGYQSDTRQQGYSHFMHEDQMALREQGTDSGNPSDHKIAKKINDALTGWFSSAYKDITYEVNDGVVTLSGTVEKLDEKRKAEDDVRKIDGVKEIHNKIQVVNNKEDSKSRKEDKKYSQDYAATESDKKINAKIRDKLKGGWFSKGYEELVIKTDNGDVVIIGAVEKYDDIKKINDKLKDIEGVKSIENQAVPRNTKK